MITIVESQTDNKDKIQKLLNLGYFDSHLSEVCKSLYTKGIFSNELICFISDRNLSNLMRSFSQRNKTYIEQEKKRKNVINSLNLYELNKNKQAKFNVGMFEILKSLSNFREDINSKFKELKKENDDFIESFDNYKKLNKKKHNIKDKNILLDLSSSYKPIKNLSFDLNSLNSDVLKESPLSITNLDKLRFYYILNRMKTKKITLKKNKSSKNTFEKNEPIVWNKEEMYDLKEIKYLKKVNKITQKKIIKNNMISNSNNEMEGYELNSNDKVYKYDKKKFKSLDDYLKYKDNIIKLKEKREKAQEIEKDKKEIDKLKIVIKETLGLEDKYKKLSSLKLNIPNNSKRKRNNLSDIKEQTFSIHRNKNAIPELINNKIKVFNSTMNKDSLFRSSSFHNLKDFNESKSKNSSMYCKDSATNIFQQSTYYSNSLNNKTTNKVHFKDLNNLKTNNRKLKKMNTIMDKNNNNFALNMIPLSQKYNARKSVFHGLNETHKSFLDDPTKNSTDNIYSVCKKIENKKFTGNRKELVNMVNNYIKMRRKESSITNKKWDLKETFSFFHNIRNKIKNDDIKYSFRNLNMIKISEGKKKLKYIDILDSNLVNQENEFLFRILNRK